MHSFFSFLAISDVAAASVFQSKTATRAGALANNSRKNLLRFVIGSRVHGSGKTPRIACRIGKRIAGNGRLRAVGPRKLSS